MAKSKYTNDFPDRARKYAEQGLNDEQIFAKLGISKDTFYRYLQKYSDFSDALKKGRELPNKEVENALYKSAIGYDYFEEHYEGDKLVKKIKKHVQGSNTAQIFWLANRLPDRWRSISKDKIDDSRPKTVGFEFEVVNDGS